ncbi:MAG: LacI family transcriptional regulator [Propionibacteriaceae bacterium]|jgi:DNA-binding LacI/PurR family transcriptional regulator|nr:LacI family transcriptional regulator [Propionibacteriaceae bacterium]
MVSMKIDDVAEALGVSKGTVSRAITGHGRIAAATRQRILDYMDEHDFRPNAAAQNLSRRQTMTLAFTIPRNRELIHYPFFLQSMTGVISEAMAHSYDILAVDNTADALRRVTRRRKVDGVIVSRNPADPAVMPQLIDSGFPFVVIGPTAVDGVTHIDHDHVAACREFTKTILRAWGGHPGLLVGPRSDLTSRGRAEGFRQGTAGASGSSTAPIVWGAVDETTVLDRFPALLEAGADVVFCGDDMICGYLELALRSGRLGRSARSIRVASFHASPTLTALNPRVPGIEFDSQAVGRLACSTLLAKMAGNPVTDVTLGFDIFVGDRDGLVNTFGAPSDPTDGHDHWKG